MNPEDRCPEDHGTAGGEYCDTCGLRLRDVAAPQAPPVPAVRPAADLHCARCGAVREGRFCEACGHDAELPAPPDAPVPAPAPGTGWTAVVRADREWFEEVRRRDGPDVATLRFPAFSTERRFALSGAQLAIGRRSRSRGIDPEIDLSAPPVDPGVSALHALLVGRADGGWALVDLESTNGTTVGDAPRPIPPHTPVPLAAGDVVKLGAWTTITLVAPADGPDQSR